MAKLTENDYRAFEEDLNLLLETLQESFEADETNYFHDDERNTLYVEIEGLETYSNNEIEEIANPVFDELDLDFDEIILVPLS